MSDEIQLDVKKLDKGFGAEVRGVDIANADDATLEALVQAFEHHGALLLRGQNLEPDDLIKYLKQFGEIEEHTLKEFTLEGYPHIYILSNRKVEGKTLGAHYDGVGWHTDYSYKDEPVKCTMLYAVEVPSGGGDTLLADLCAAYDALSDERKEQLEGLVLHHSYKYFMENREHGRMKLSPQLEAENPDVFHPLIRTHPADGRKALWVSTGTVKGIVGMEKEEADKLIEELVEFVTQERFVYRHKWQVGDILVWDNRCTLHTGTTYDDANSYRIAYRLWAKGDKPY